MLGTGPREQQGDQGMAVVQARRPEERRAGNVGWSQAGRTLKAGREAQRLPLTALRPFAQILVSLSCRLSLSLIVLGLSTPRAATPTPHISRKTRTGQVRDGGGVGTQSQRNGVGEVESRVRG